VARVDITPPMELKASLGGYGARMNRPATGVHDRVWAKALVLRQGSRRFALVTADILAFPPGFKAAVMERLAKEGWKEEQVMLLASHSHTSIDMEAINPKNTFGIPQIGIFQQALYDRTVRLISQGIRDAGKGETPCTVGTTSIALNGWSHNRRSGNTAVQPELTVTRIDTAHGALAALVNWTAHPTFMDAEDMLFSGDWPGQMQRMVEALIGGGVTVMYYNGAQGDQAPIARPDSGENWEKAERYGRELGIQVWKVWQTIRPRGAAPLVYHLEPISLPKRTPHPDFMKTGGAEYGLSQENIGEIVERLVPTATHSISLRIGDLVIMGVPGELAATLGDDVKARVRSALGLRHVVIGGLADEWISYMLTPEEYHKGGYEASMSFYGESLGSTVVEGVAHGANSLH
jgi:neutral ceramidase